MDKPVVIPGWALAIFVPIALGLITWGLSYLSRRIHEDLQKLSAKFDALQSDIKDFNNRLIRLETVVYGSHQYARMTPPVGVPHTIKHDD